MSEPEPNPENQELTFTPLIKQLQANSWKPDEVFKELREAISIALRIEMKKRGLWDMPPVWLGDEYEIWNSWSNPEAFDALCIDCYIFAIIKQYKNLQAVLKTSDNIEGLIFLNIRYFVSNIQKKNDSLGHAVAQHARDAVQCAIDKGILVPSELNYKGKVGNKTLLTASSSNTSITPLEKSAILKVLSQNKVWADIRLKLAGKSQAVQEPLCEIICQLTKSDVLCFQFKTLVNAMKEEVRKARQENFAKQMALDIENTIFEETEEDNDTVSIMPVQLIEPDTTYEDYESFHELVKQVQEAINQLESQQRVRERLHQVFAEIVDYIETEGEEPFQTELVKKLDIPKATLSGDMKTLRQLVQQIKSNNLK